MTRARQAVSMSGAAWLGGVHLAVDATCVTAVLRASPPSDMVGSAAVALVLGYDMLAFAGQLPLGWLLDRFRAWREAALVGVLLTAAAVLLGGRGGVATVVAAGLGNALFHVGAGAMSLDGSGGKAAPAGVFVAPGALGLGLGMHLGRRALQFPTWPLLIAMGLSVAVVVLLHARRAEREPARPTPVEMPSSVWLTTVLLLFVSVAVRSLVGAVGCDACPKLAVIAIGLPVAGFAGKLVGGFLADRFGWLDVGVAALLASAPLLAFSGGAPWTVLPGLFLFQMTMPVTLAAVYRVLVNRPGVAFGLLCLALAVGAAPVYLPGGWRPHGTWVLLLVLGSAAALYLALRRIEPQPRPVTAVPVRVTNRT